MNYNFNERVGEHVSWPLYPSVDPDLSRVLKNKHQAVSQGVRRFGKRSPPEADEHLQKPHNAGSRREARFFNTLLRSMQGYTHVRGQKLPF